jgi:hypothetical protein
LLDLSTRYVAKDGAVQPIHLEKAEVAAAITEMAGNGLRTIAVCYKDLDQGEENKDDRVETNLVSLSILSPSRFFHSLDSFTLSILSPYLILFHYLL